MTFLLPPWLTDTIFNGADWAVLAPLLLVLGVALYLEHLRGTR